MSKSERPSAHEAKLNGNSQRKGPTLAALTALERVSIAEDLFSNIKWRYIGLCFEKSHGFEKSYKELKASHKEDDDRNLCENLIDFLSNRGITVPELAEALRQKVINMHSIADTFMQQYCADDSHGSDLMQIDTQSDTLYQSEALFDKVRVVGAVPELNTRSQTPPDDLRAIIDATENNVVTVIKGLSTALNTETALNYTASDTCQQFAYHAWINASSDKEVLNSVNQMKIAFGLPLRTPPDFDSLKDDLSFQLIVEVFKKFNALIIFNDCRLDAKKIDSLYRAFKPTAVTQHSIVITTVRKLSDVAFSYKTVVVEKPIECSESKRHFLELMVFVGQQSVHTALFGDLSSTFDQLLQNKLISLDESKQLITIEESAWNHFIAEPMSNEKRKRLISKWLSIMRAANQLFSDNEEKEERAQILSSIGAQLSTEDELIEQYLMTVVEFIYWQGYFCSDGPELIHEKSKSKYPHHYALIKLSENLQLESNANEKQSCLTILSNSTLTPQLQLIYNYGNAISLSSIQLNFKFDVLIEHLNANLPHDHPFKLRLQLLQGALKLQQYQFAGQQKDIRVDTICNHIEWCHKQIEKHAKRDTELLAESEFVMGKAYLLTPLHTEQSKQLFTQSLVHQFHSKSCKLDESFMYETEIHLLRVSRKNGPHILYSNSNCSLAGLIKQLELMKMSKRKTELKYGDEYVISFWKKSGISQLNVRNDNEAILVWHDRKNNNLTIGFYVTQRQ